MSGDHFLRTDTADGARFDVTPMPRSQSGVYMLGCFGVVLPAIVALAGLSFGGMSGLLLSGILWGPLALLAYFANKKMTRYSRDPKSLLVSKAGVTVDGTFYPASDIAEFKVQLPDDHGGTRYESAPRTTGAQIGQSVRNDEENRSYCLMARLRSDSRPKMLVFGLTFNTAKALMQDVAHAMND